MQIFLIAAVSADGFIARESNQISTQWTSKEDAAWFGQKTKAAQFCVMGKTTFQTIGRPLKDRTVIVLSSQAPASIDPMQLVAGGVVETSLSPQELVSMLVTQEVEQLAVCGGSSVYTQFLQAGLVDRIFLTIEPILFGAGIRLCKESVDTNMKLKQVHHLSDQTVVLEYRVEK